MNLKLPLVHPRLQGRKWMKTARHRRLRKGAVVLVGQQGGVGSRMSRLLESRAIWGTSGINHAWAGGHSR